LLLNSASFSASFLAVRILNHFALPFVIDYSVVQSGFAATTKTSEAGDGESETETY
jgi:hypothetical protein